MKKIAICIYQRNDVYFYNFNSLNTTIKKNKDCDFHIYIYGNIKNEHLEEMKLIYGDKIKKTVNFENVNEKGRIKEIIDLELLRNKEDGYFSSNNNDNDEIRENFNILYNIYKVSLLKKEKEIDESFKYDLSILINLNEIPTGDILNLFEKKVSFYKSDILIAESETFDEITDICSSYSLKNLKFCIEKNEDIQETINYDADLQIKGKIYNVLNKHDILVENCDLEKKYQIIKSNGIKFYWKKYENINFCISGTQKCGSTSYFFTIKNAISRKINCDGEYNKNTGGYDFLGLLGESDNLGIKNITVMRNHIDSCIFNDNIVFISIRNQREIYPSAYFESLSNPEYEYNIFNTEETITAWKNLKGFERRPFMIEKYNKEIKGNYEKIIDHFNKQAWSKYNFLNNYVTLDKIKQHGLLEKIPFKKNGYVIRPVNDSSICVFIDYKIINNPDKFNNIFRELNLDLNVEKIERENISQLKFYGEDYNNVCSILKKNNYYDENYYDFLDNSIFEIIN